MTGRAALSCQLLELRELELWSAGKIGIAHDCVAAVGNRAGTFVAWSHILRTKNHTPANRRRSNRSLGARNFKIAWRNGLLTAFCDEIVTFQLRKGRFGVK